MPTTLAMLADRYTLAMSDLDAAERHAASAVGGFLSMAQAWHDAREGDPKAVTVRGLASAIGASTKEASKVLVLGDVVSTLGMPDTLPDDALPILRAAWERMGTLMGSKGGQAAILAMSADAPEGADAWHVVARLAREGKAAKASKGERKPKSDAQRLAAALAAIGPVDGTTLDADGVRALADLARAVNVIVGAVKATREGAEAVAA